MSSQEEPHQAETVVGGPPRWRLLALLITLVAVGALVVVGRARRSAH